MYGPPDSDSDEADYDGFSFGDDIDEEGNRIRRSKPKNFYQPKLEDQIRDQLRNCAEAGDVNEFRRIFNNQKNIIGINDVLSAEWTALMFACYNGHLDLVRCLINDFNADVNKSMNSGTALLLACSADRTDEETMHDIVKILLENKALVNVRNRNGETPLIMAIISGFESIVNLLLPHATLEACDNGGNTALFFAVNYNRYDITKLLIEHGAFTKIRNRYGDEPKQLASYKGYTDIEALFPAEEVHEMIPIKYLSYISYEDLLPTAYPDNDKPAYVQDIFSLLYGMRVPELDVPFAKAEVSLPQLLCATDESLKKIGVVFPFQRNRIILGLLKFHQRPFMSKTLLRPSITEPTKLNNYFDIFSGCVKHFIILRCSLAFINSGLLGRNDEITTKSELYIKNINQLLVEVLEFTQNLQRHITMIEKRTPKPPPLFIDQNSINHLKARGFIKCLFFKSVAVVGLLGVGSIIYAVIKKRL